MRGGGGGENEKEVRVLPRILFEEWSINDFMDLFGDLQRMESLGDFVASKLEVGK